MMSFFVPFCGTAPGVYYAYQNSDGVGKAIVLMLVFGSMVTWSVMLDKLVALSKAKGHSLRFIASFRAREGHIASTALVQYGAADPGPVAKIYSRGVEQLREFYENDESNRACGSMVGASRPARLTDEQYDAIEAVMQREVSHQLEDLETRIGLLGTLVSVSPFCGLFGTVWGVMLGFCGIAAAGKSDFAALAPGVAGALLTTVAGLIVAIPSLVGYNWLNGTIRILTVMMDNFTEEFMVQLQLEQLKLAQEQPPAPRQVPPTGLQQGMPAPVPAPQYRQPVPQVPPPVQQVQYQQPVPPPASSIPISGDLFQGER